MRYSIVNNWYLLILFIPMSILTLPSICFSANFSVNCGKPYSSGSVTIPASSALDTDTIHFSNDISISCFNQTTRIPEPVLLYHGISIDTTPSLVNAGYRYLPTATWQKQKLSPDSLTKFLASGDTVWGLSKSYPDSLLRLDNLYNDDPIPAFKRGSWLYYSDGDLSYGNWVRNMENFNNIIYIQSTRNKMKLQVSNLYISYSGGMRSSVDSLRILWAVDSLGNGMFKESTAIKSSNTPSGSKHQASLSRRYDNNAAFLQNSGCHISLFDIQGRQNKCYALASGIFIYKIGNSKAAVLGNLR